MAQRLKMKIFNHGNFDGTTVRLHWTNQPYKGHINLTGKTSH